MNNALQDTLSSQGWIKVEEMLEAYIKQLEDTKPDTSDQFRMTWGIAHNTGGVDNLRAFFNLLDQEARKL